jgi:hypothetical protein
MAHKRLGRDRRDEMTRIDRRTLIGCAALLPMAGLAGCMAGDRGWNLEEGVRRLLTLSSQRAFDRLLAPGGFYDDQLTRITPPEGLETAERGRNVLARIMQTQAMRRQIAIALNDAAGEAAERATPIVLEAISGMSFADAYGVLRGGPTAATDVLRAHVGGALLDAMFPEVSRGLRSDMAEIAGAALEASTGIDYVELSRTVAAQASNGIFRAIGREEAAIRADPESSRDPMLVALLGGGGGRGRY